MTPHKYGKGCQPYRGCCDVAVEIVVALATGEEVFATGEVATGEETHVPGDNAKDPNFSLDSSNLGKPLLEYRLSSTRFIFGNGLRRIFSL